MWLIVFGDVLFLQGTMGGTIGHEKDGLPPQSSRIACKLPCLGGVLPTALVPCVNESAILAESFHHTDLGGRHVADRD